MQIVSDFTEVQDAQPSVCTIGMFDGVHLGHRALIGATVSDARAKGMRSVVVTFFPHPRQVLTGKPVLTITSPAERANLIAEIGVDLLVMLRFTKELAALTADEFMDRMIRHLNVRSLWIGYDFALGKGRVGDATYLYELGKGRGYSVHVVQPLDVWGATVSSSRIREAVQRGEWDEVRQLLGHGDALEM